MAITSGYLSYRGLMVTAWACLPFLAYSDCWNQEAYKACHCGKISVIEHHHQQVEKTKNQSDITKNRSFPKNDKKNIYQGGKKKEL